MLTFLRRDSLIVGCLAAAILAFFLSFASLGAMLTALIAVILLAAGFTALSFCSFAHSLAPYRRTVIVSVICCAVMLSCCYYFCNYKNRDARAMAEAGTTCRIEGYATERNDQGSYGFTEVKVTEMDGKSCDFNLLLCRTDHPSPTPYRVFTADITFEHENDLLVYYQDENIVASATVNSLVETEEKAHSVSAFFYQISDRIDSYMHTHLSKNSASLCSALILGRQQWLADSTKRDFRTLGISHTLAVSGLHLTVLTAGVLFILGRLRARRWLRICVSLLLILLFAGLCGFSPSILRAAVMSICLLLADGLGAPLQGQRALIFSVTAILLFSPYLICSASFLMSSLSTLGLLTIYPIFEERISEGGGHSLLSSVIKHLLLQICLTLSAVVMTLPVSFFYFKSISLAGFAANLIFVPLITLFMYLLPICLILLAVPWIGIPAAWIVEGFAGIILRAATLGRYCKDVNCHIPVGILIAVAVILLCTPFFRSARKRAVGLIPAAALVLTLFLCVPLSMTGSERLVYRYDDKRETLLLANGNEVLYIETGNASRQNGYTALSEAQDALHQTGIDHLMLTHYHSKSPSLVKYLADNTYLETVYLPSFQTESEKAVHADILRIASERNLSVVTYRTDSMLSVCGFRVRVHTELLHRSAHPAQAIEIVAQNGRVLAADPAIFELDGIGAPDLTGVDHLLLLNSPPIDKYPLPAFQGKDALSIIFSSEAQYEAVGADFGQCTVLTNEIPRVYIEFPPKNES